MRITINTDEELVQLTKDLLHILVNLRSATKDWQEHYGYRRGEKKKMWEGKADDLISKLDAKRKHSSAEYHITVKIEQ